MKEHWIPLRTLVHVVAFAFLILQMVFAVQKYIAKPTMMSPETKPFSSLTKPLQITVCKVDQFNYTQAAGLAYLQEAEYLAGVTTNQTVLSWTGLNETHTFEETLHFLYNSNDKITFNSGLLWFHSGPISGTITNKFLLPYGLCKVFEGKPASYMIIKLEPKEMSPHMMFISNPTASTSFQLPYSLMFGDPNNLQPPQYVTYNIKIKETTVLTDDGSCVVYQNNNHESYSDCVVAEMRARILPTLDCMIPWISKRDRCTKHIQKLPKHELLLNWIFNIIRNSWGGIEYKSKSCPTSCTLLSAYSKKISSGISVLNPSTIFLHFGEEIQVEKIVLDYDSTALLVEIGSCLGLWLGLSVVGIFDLVVLAAMKTQGWLGTIFLWASKTTISATNRNPSAQLNLHPRA